MIRIERCVYKSPLGERPTVYYKDLDTQMEYRHVLGGFAYPTLTKPGYIVILGQEQVIVFDKYPIRVLAEYEASDPTTLFKRAVDFRNQAAVPHFYGTSNKVMSELLCRFNLQASGPAGWLHIADAPLHDDPGALGHYLMLIKERTAKGQKTLQFGKESKLPSMLMALTEEDTLQRPESFPAVAALGYALAAMEEFDAAHLSKQEYEAVRARVITQREAEEQW